MNSKRLQALKYYLMSSFEKKKVIKSLPNEIAVELIQYVKELDDIIPPGITEHEKKQLLSKVFEESFHADPEWNNFSESVLKEMSGLNIFPEKLRKALIELE